jgi:O-antigen/teichoic acid export membrane protein
VARPRTELASLRRRGTAAVSTGAVSTGAVTSAPGGQACAGDAGADGQAALTGGSGGPSPRTSTAQAPPPDLARVARGGVAGLVGAGASALLTVALTVLVTRSFSKAQAGVFFAAMSLFLIASGVANLGAYNGVVYFVARFRALGMPDRIDGALRAAIRPVVIASCMLAVVMFAAAGPVARHVLGGAGTGQSHAVLATAAVRALALALPFAAMLDTFLAATRGYREMRPTVVIDKLARPITQVLLIGVVAAVGSATQLAPSWALPYVPAAAVAWLWLRRVRRRHHGTSDARGHAHHLARGHAHRPAGRHAHHPARGHAHHPAGRHAHHPARGHAHHPARGHAHRLPCDSREFWRFTAPRSLATLAQIVIQRLDIVLVGVLRGPAEAAVYTAATRFLVAGQLGNAAISMAAQPRFTELFAVGDRRGANTVYQTTTAWLVVLTWPLYLLAMIYARTVLAVFGHAYHAGAAVMLVLGFAMLVATGCGLVDMVLTTTGRTTWSLANGLLAVTVNVGVDLALIPTYGMVGAAIGWAAAIGVTNLVPLAQVAAVVRVHPFGRGALASCGLAVICFGAIPLLARVTGGSGPGTDAVAVTAGCALYALGLWRLRGDLHLAAMPGLPRFIRALSSQSGEDWSNH